MKKWSAFRDEVLEGVLEGDVEKVWRPQTARR
jgi:hypothetical protein